MSHPLLDKTPITITKGEHHALTHAYKRDKECRCRELQKETRILFWTMVGVPIAATLYTFTQPYEAVSQAASHMRIGSLIASIGFLFLVLCAWGLIGLLFRRWARLQERRWLAKQEHLDE
jgi:hypothetical protein